VKYLNPRPEQHILPGELYREFDAYMAQFGIRQGDRRRKEHLIQCLHKAQEIFGYLPEEVQLHVADTLGLHHAEVSGVISFYNYFTTTPKGTYRINVCMGTACYVKESLRCVGACGLAPVVMINETAYGKVQSEHVREILAQYLVTV
jgi:NADH:ubiquinone oxidoreductase subunit E